MTTLGARQSIAEQQHHGEFCAAVRRLRQSSASESLGQLQQIT